MPKRNFHNVILLYGGGDKGCMFESLLANFVAFYFRKLCYCTYVCIYKVETDQGVPLPYGRRSLI